MKRPIRSLVASILTLALAPATVLAAPAAKPKAAPPQQQAPTPLSLSQAEIAQRASVFLNGLENAATEFTQTNPDGRRFTGRFYLSRPGKLRFDYDPPAALEIVADGTTVMVRDRKLNTQNAYPIGQTPLAFLLQADLDLARDLRLTGAARSAQGAWVAFESPSTFVGTSKVALFFDEGVERLLQWRVVDAQNQQTTVTLGPLDRTQIADPRMFDIKFQSVR